MKEEVFRNSQIRNMHEMGEMKRAQEFRVDEISVNNQQSRENHETIQQLTSQLQQKEEHVNSMNDSGDFQDVERGFGGADEEPLMRYAVTQQAPVLCTGLSGQLSPGHGSLPRAGHRRGLVEEVAPGVVDVSAIALSSAPNVITFVVTADEADLQGPTWVDSDDDSIHNEPLVTIAEGTTVPIVDSESDLSARAIRRRFESPPASAVQCSGVFGGLTKRDRLESQVSAPSRIRMVQNRFEFLDEEDEQDFEMSPTRPPQRGCFLGEQMLPPLPVSSGAVRRADCGWSAAATFLKAPPWCCGSRDGVCRMRVNWSKKEQFWQRKHTALVARRDGCRRQMFHAAHTWFCGVSWMGNCLQRDKLLKVQRQHLGTQKTHER